MERFRILRARCSAEDKIVSLAIKMWHCPLKKIWFKRAHRRKQINRNWRGEHGSGRRQAENCEWDWSVQRLDFPGMSPSTPHQIFIKNFSSSPPAPVRSSILWKFDSARNYHAFAIMSSRVSVEISWQRASERKGQRRGSKGRNGKGKPHKQIAITDTPAEESQEREKRQQPEHGTLAGLGKRLNSPFAGPWAELSSREAQTQIQSSFKGFGGRYESGIFPCMMCDDVNKKRKKACEGIRDRRSKNIQDAVVQLFFYLNYQLLSPRIMYQFI